MGADLFPGMHDAARLWVIALDAATDGGQGLEDGLATLFGQWRHKGQAYSAAWEFLEDRLLLVVEPHMAEPSGCAIDGMLRKVQTLAERHGRRVLGEDRVLVRLSGGLRDFDRAELGLRIADGTLRGDTPVLDRALHHLGQLRADGLEKPMARTWIGRKHRIPVQA